MKSLVKMTVIGAIILFAFNSCKKESSSEEIGNITIGITDTRGTLQKVGEDIIDASKLSKFEVTISRLELRTDEGDIIQGLSEETIIDLRNYQGNVNKFPSVEVPVGDYTGVLVYFSGVSITYDGNNYTASTTTDPLVTLSGYPSVSFSTIDGVPDIFIGEKGVDITFDFKVVKDSTSVFNITFDAVAACYEIEIDCPVCSPNLIYFAGLRPVFEKHMNLYFEEGIQQIKHSPPLNIELAGGTTTNYQGIHTFIDFNEVGGTITQHASQHVYRGTDGTLNIEIGSMVANEAALTPNTINAIGTTDVTADEVFDFAFINSELIGKGYTLLSGSTYYFSLKKTWTITSGDKRYTITRVCEPYPVLWPPL